MPYTLHVNPKFPMYRVSGVDRNLNDEKRGAQASNVFGYQSRQSLPTDPVSTVDISFSGVKNGSEIKIFSYEKTLLSGTESSNGIPIYTLSRYAPGSLFNTVRILIMNLGYEVIDLTYDIPITNSTIPVFQRIDRNYRNPS